ncbi:MAG TPA: HAD-IIB family hydrolase [Chitinophagaceae bacterium]|nr:HAD-IIB family hydrolase [Chitinophagaceae bacterium]
MILATDLDGTFLGGKRLHKQQLYELVKDNYNIMLVFLTGRGLETVIPLFNDPVIPRPDFIICDVGATIVNGHTLEPIEPLQQDIEKKWPGSMKVLDCLKDISGLQYQEVPQQRRCSFFLNNESILTEIRSLVNQLGCDIVYSAGKYLDVLAKSINKGSSLTNLVNHLEVKASDIMVAGDTMNDLAMFQCGFKGVIVGDAEEGLIESTKHIPHIYRTECPGAGGIIMGMEHFGFISRFSNK